MRSLVTIQRINALYPIPNADFIELAEVMNWRAVVKKGEFSVGDKCVYFEVDSFLPIEDRYEFLRNSSYRNNEFMGEGFRIRTQTLRGCLSQGVILPITIDSSFENLEVGTDVTEILGVRKWELPEVECNGDMVIIGDKPYGIPTSDELRVQSYGFLREELLGKPYYITTKMDGTSMVVYNKDGDFGVCSRTNNLKQMVGNYYWSCAARYGLPQKLVDNNMNIAIQGEFCGPKIQKNRLKLLEPHFYVFDMIDLNTNQYIPYDEMCKIAEELGLEMVPLEEKGEAFNYTVEELLEKAEGLYPSGQQKEGIVVRSLTPTRLLTGQRLSFKVLNNKFLLKEGKS